MILSCPKFKIELYYLDKETSSDCPAERVYTMPDKG